MNQLEYKKAGRIVTEDALKTSFWNPRNPNGNFSHARSSRFLRIQVLISGSKLKPRSCLCPL